MLQKAKININMSQKLPKYPNICNIKLRTWLYHNMKQICF